MPNITVTNLLTSPTGVADVDGFGMPIYLDGSAVKTYSMTSRQLDAMSAALTSARKLGYISYTIAANPSIDVTVDALAKQNGVTAAMTAGSVTVVNTAVRAGSVILLQPVTPGGTQGILRVSTITAGTSFVISSSSGTDTSTVQWCLIA